MRDSTYAAHNCKLLENIEEKNIYLFRFFFFLQIGWEVPLSASFAAILMVSTASKPLSERNPWANGIGIGIRNGLGA